MPLVYQTEASSTIVGSPAAAAETVICQTPAITVDFTARLVYLTSAVNMTVGTSGTAVTLRLRRTGLTGTLVIASPALTAVAANIISIGIDTTDTPGDLSGLVYVLTAQVTAGAATSTIGTVALAATAVQ